MTPIKPRLPSRAGKTLPVSLEQTIIDHTGHHANGPHTCGRAELLPDGRVLVSLVDAAAGRHVAGMLKDGLLDVVLWKKSVRLR